MTDTNPAWPLPQPDSLGALIGADDVCWAVKETILQWSPYYLAVISGRLASAGVLGQPLQEFGTWVNEPDFRSLGTGQPAAFLVTSPATVGTPDLQGSGQYRVTWRAQVIVQVFGTSWEEARDRTSWYEKAVRWCIVQHPGLNGLAVRTKWAGNQYAGKIHTSTRTEGQVTMAFNVDIGNAVEAFRGPATVPALPVPPAQDPTVETVDVTVTQVPVTEPI